MTLPGCRTPLRLLVSKASRPRRGKLKRIGRATVRVAAVRSDPARCGVDASEGQPRSRRQALLLGVGVGNTKQKGWLNGDVAAPAGQITASPRERRAIRVRLAG